MAWAASALTTGQPPGLTMLYVFLYHQLHLFTAETSGSNILFVSSKQLKVVDTYTGDLWLSSDLSVCIYCPYQGLWVMWDAVPNCRLM